MIFIIPRAINYWNTSEFEKVFMTNFEKLKVNFTKISLVVIVILVFTYFRMSSQPEIFKDLLDDTNTLIMVLGVVGVFLVVFGQLGFMIILWIDKEFSVSIDYYIEFGDSEEWKIEKMSTNNCLIIQKKSNKKTRIMLEEWKGKEIIEVRSEKIPFRKWFESTRRYKNIPISLIINQGILILLSLAMIVCSLIFKHLVVMLIIYFIGIIGLFLSMIIFKNYIEYKKALTNLEA